MEIIDSMTFLSMNENRKCLLIFLLKRFEEKIAEYFCVKSFDDNSLWYDRLKEYKKDLNMLLGIYIYFWDFLKSYYFFCLIMIWLKFECFFG